MNIGNNQVPNIGINNNPTINTNMAMKKLSETAAVAGTENVGEANPDTTDISSTAMETIGTPAGKPALNTQRQYIESLITRTAKKHGLPPIALKAVVWQESRWNRENPSFDGGHGKGLGQIDDRWHELSKTPQVWDPIKNLDYGANHLKKSYQNSGKNWKTAFKKYNGGSDYPPIIFKHIVNEPWNNQKTKIKTVSKAPPEGVQPGDRADGASADKPALDLRRQYVSTMIGDMAKKHKVPNQLLKSICWEQSTWQMDVQSPDGHNKGLMGINDKYNPIAKTSDVWDGYTNLDEGCKILTNFHKQNGGGSDWTKALQKFGGKQFANNVLKHAKKEPWNYQFTKDQETGLTSNRKKIDAKLKAKKKSKKKASSAPPKPKTAAQKQAEKEAAKKAAALEAQAIRKLNQWM